MKRDIATMNRELNQHRTDGGWIDWDLLKDSVRARPGDTLTLDTVDDIGPETVRPMKIIDTLVKRGVIVDCTAICPDRVQLAGIHAKHRDAERQRKGAEGGGGGRPQKHTDEEVRAAWDAIRDGTVTTGEVKAVFGISKSTMSRRCAVQGLEYPPTYRDSSQRVDDK